MLRTYLNVIISPRLSIMEQTVSVDVNKSNSRWNPNGSGKVAEWVVRCVRWAKRS